MTIRDAQLSDATSIKSLLAQLGYPGFTHGEVEEKLKLHLQPGYHVIVAEKESQVIGFIALHWFDLMHHAGRLGRITAFCVDEAFRSRQVGKKMLAVAEEFLRRHGCERVEVTSNNNREGAHRFYLNAGYGEPSRRFARNLQ